MTIQLISLHDFRSRFSFQSVTLNWFKFSFLFINFKEWLLFYCHLIRHYTGFILCLCVRNGLHRVDCPRSRCRPHHHQRRNHICLEMTMENLMRQNQDGANCRQLPNQRCHNSNCRLNWYRVSHFNIYTQKSNFYINNNKQIKTHYK